MVLLTIDPSLAGLKSYFIRWSDNLLELYKVFGRQTFLLLAVDSWRNSHEGRCSIVQQSAIPLETSVSPEQPHFAGLFVTLPRLISPLAKWIWFCRVFSVGCEITV